MLRCAAFRSLVVALFVGATSPHMVSAVPVYEVTGVLVAQDTGSPISHHTIYLHPVTRTRNGRRVTVTEQFRSVTDAQGHFRFREIPCGTFALAGAHAVEQFENPTRELLVVVRSKSVSLGQVRMLNGLMR